MTTLTIPLKTIEKVEKQLTKALKDVRRLKQKNIQPKNRPNHFWTKKEWDEAEKEADQDIKARRVYKLENVKDLDKPALELFNEPSDNATI